MPSRRPFGQSSLSIYVDGNLMITCALKFPSLSKVGKVQLDSFHLNVHTSESYHNLKGAMLHHAHVRVYEKHFSPTFFKYRQRVQEAVFICLSPPPPPPPALVF